MKNLIQGTKLSVQQFREMVHVISRDLQIIQRMTVLHMLSVLDPDQSVDYFQLSVYPTHLHKFALTNFRYIPIETDNDYGDDDRPNRRFRFIISTECMKSLNLQIFMIQNEKTKIISHVLVYNKLPVAQLDISHYTISCGLRNQHRDLITESNVNKFLHAVNEWYNEKMKLYDESFHKGQISYSKKSSEIDKIKDLRQFSVKHFRTLENRIKILQQKLKRHTK